MPTAGKKYFPSYVFGSGFVRPKQVLDGTVDKTWLKLV